MIKLKTASYFSFLFSLMLTITSYSQSSGAYQIYTAKGKKVKTDKMIQSLEGYDYVFFGEYHDNPISHWLQYEVTLSLHAKYGEKLVLAFEMFERDQQDLMNAYLKGEVDSKFFEDSCRLWPNYKTDYKPLIDFAKDTSLKVVASNVPRRFANLLYKRGRQAVDSLSAQDKEWMADPYFEVDTTLSQYAQLIGMGQHMGGGDIMLAQAFKDATMAKFTMMDKSKGDVVIHFNGAYHSDYHQGIMWYIQQKEPEAEIITISTVSQKDITRLEKDNFNKADFIICVDEDMTSTH